ncbi:MAG: hypothetical protein LUD69_08665 [Oscillospiraceae bacterium]|nr:hypothetical protein [Oscillospiraceae bacterium]
MAGDFVVKEGAKAQEYLMYFKLLQRIFATKDPQAAAGAFNQCFPRTRRGTKPCGAPFLRLAARGSADKCAARKNFCVFFMFADSYR